MRFALPLILASFGVTATGFGSDIFVNDSQNIYDYTPGGTRTTFSNLAGGTVLQMAFDSAGNLYEAARDDNAIYKITPAGVRSTFASVSSPWGLTIDTAGNIYTAVSASTLVKFTPGGAITTVGTGLAAYGLAADVSGNVYERDSTGNIYEYSSTGVRTTYATGAPSGFGIAIDSSGNAYVSNWVNFTVSKFTPGTGWSTFGSLPSQQLATGLAFDASGTLYVSEVANGVSNCCIQDVYTFDSSGNRSTFATGLYTPYGLAIQQTPSSTPEPASYAMFAGGACLLAALRRRK